MIFNCHWMHYIIPYYISIHLADRSVLHSEGIGSIRFICVVNGQDMMPLEFINILNVSTLFTNLFFVLYLTMHCYFSISIALDTLHFIKNGQTVFQVKVSSSNAAYLVGNTIPVKEFASLIHSHSPHGSSMVKCIKL
jgi:hypothetical protein